jgi:hypothetical protein
MSPSSNDLQTLASEEQALVAESGRRLAVRNGIDRRRMAAQHQTRREKPETVTRFDPKHKGEITMMTIRRPSVLSKRLPLSGNTALASSALIQAVLGVEFVLSGLNKLADSRYVSEFGAFVRATPGATSGVLSALVRALVLPNADLFARLIELSELTIGVALLTGAVEIGRRRFAGRLGAPHEYERPLALASAVAGLAAAGLTLSIGILMGEGFPGVAAGNAFDSAIPIELFIVPLGIAIAWVEFGRFRALRRSAPSVAVRSRPVRQPQAA